nr:hypothetical protein [Halarchaeum solikamskense]
MTPDAVAWLALAVTAVVGLFVALLADRGYRRNDQPRMRSLAVGIALLTTGVFVAVAVLASLGVGAGVVLLARGVVTVLGLCAVLYALVSDQ